MDVAIETQQPPSIAVEKWSRIPSLDGLRAVAIVLVIVDHLLGAVVGNIYTRPVGRLVLATVGNGGFGVRIFFVISGFLITHLLLKELSSTNTINIRQFYLRRVFRICPALYVYVVVVVALGVCGVVAVTGKEVLHAVTFTWIYNFSYQNWVFAHTWSLSVEEQFYLFWPAVLLVLKPVRGAILAVVLIVLAPLGRVGFALTSHGLAHRLLYCVANAKLDYLMCGCLAAIVWPNLAALIKSARPASTGLALALGAVSLATSAAQEYRPDLRLHLPIVAFGDTAESIGIVACVCVVVARPTSMAGRWLNWPTLARIGVLSYSLYIWQQLFLMPKHSTWFQHTPVNAILTFVAGALSYRFVERPFLRLRTRLSGDRRPAGPGL